MWPNDPHQETQLSTAIDKVRIAPRYTKANIIQNIYCLPYRSCDFIYDANEGGGIKFRHIVRLNPVESARWI